MIIPLGVCGGSHTRRITVALRATPVRFSGGVGAVQGRARVNLSKQGKTLAKKLLV